ncbi:MAG: Eco57I restriction-modification methylase domain-containing protein, partial [Deltaproteobacteria bacterium]|nr:Eco57I restriction-modification methylase domain-containing protein [Deltaproteobacteria bacterium]
YAEASKDVMHEDSIRIGSAIKAPDYCFRIGGARKFFLEAKKPSINIREDTHPAYQLRRYAWSAKLPLSILTDFEEFAVYDCRVKPTKTDKASTARVFYFTYDNYMERWDEFRSIFSKEAVLQGSFDRYVESSRIKRGTAEVDRAFLAEIERWREMLARNIALRNPALTQRELNFAVQRTIDRIIFLRICEDRGIEDYGRLQALQNGTRIYERLCQYFDRADERYNSGLFHFRSERDRPGNPDRLTPNLGIDDKVLKDLLKTLYYPDSPYEFSVLPADILGQVYEQFLGKVIRLTPGHRAVVEEKPEVKKAGGVYYTPTYIVDYIVKETVGKLLQGKTHRRAVKVRILDPACGSGSFLIGAYQYLLDWHRDQYVNDDPEKYARMKKPRLYEGRGGDWKLTTAERKRILLNNIFGVDIDPQAVEVTKLSLLLKVLEDEDAETIGKTLALFHERALPDLGNNIKCGNSLIGPDFYEGEQLSLLDEEEIIRINAFDWEKEFPDILKNGGFDVVIGNPPYVRQEQLGSFKTYFQGHYKTYHGVADLYTYFIERGIMLLRRGGYFSYIVANKWMRANYGNPLREWLKSQKILHIIDFGDLPVFQKVTTYPCIVVTQKGNPGKTFKALQVKSLDFPDLKAYADEHFHSIQQGGLDGGGWSLADEKSQTLLEKLKKTGIPLGEYVKGEIYRGILTGLNEAFVIDGETRERLIAEDPKSAEIIKPFLAGKDIKRYQPLTNDKFLIFTRRGIDIDKYPAIKQHLLQYKERLMPRPRNWQGEKWQGRKPGSYQWYEIQ